MQFYDSRFTIVSCSYQQKLQHYLSSMLSIEDKQGMGKMEEGGREDGEHDPQHLFPTPFYMIPSTYTLMTYIRYLFTSNSVEIIPSDVSKKYISAQRSKTSINIFIFRY